MVRSCCVLLLLIWVTESRAHISLCLMCDSMDCSCCSRCWRSPRFRLQLDSFGDFWTWWMESETSRREVWRHKCTQNSRSPFYLKKSGSLHVCSESCYMLVMQQIISKIGLLTSISLTRSHFPHISLWTDSILNKRPFFRLIGYPLTTLFFPILLFQLTSDEK